MKKTYSSFCCPHCGAKDINLLHEDIFECEYCKQKFSFDFENIEICAENKVFIDELKGKFDEQLKDLKLKRIVINNYLAETEKLAHPELLLRITLGFLVVSLFILFISLTVEGVGMPLSIVIPLVIISAVLFVLAIIRRQIKSKNYRPLISFYASKIIECEEKINEYTALISKLTK